MTSFFKAAAAFALSICALSAQAASPTLDRIRASGELRVGMDVGYMPFELRDRRGNFIGFDIDLGRLMARELGVRFVAVNTQWDGIIPALITGKFDILMGGMTITPERAQQVDFADPYIVVGQSVLIASRLAASVKSYRDLDAPQYRIATKLGTTGDIAAVQYLPHAQIRKYESESEALMEVRNGRADAFVYDSPYNTVYLARNPGSLVHLSEPFTREPLGFALPKGDPEYRAWVNAFLARIKQNGAYDALYGKWFVRTAWIKQADDR